MPATRQPQTSNYTTSNRSRSNSRSIQQDPGGPTYKASTISFSGNTISDSANGFAPFASYVGNSIEVRGSASNNRVYIVTSYAAGALGVTTFPGAASACTTEAAGALVSIFGTDEM